MVEIQLALHVRTGLEMVWNRSKWIQNRTCKEVDLFRISLDLFQTGFRTVPHKGNPVLISPDLFETSPVYIKQFFLLHFPL